MSNIDPLDLYKALFEPFPDSVKSTQSMGKKGKITFVEWYHYIARAWRTFPKGFSTEITKLASIGDHLIMVVRVTDIATGCHQEATGSAFADKGKANFGGANAEAESQALRRAFAKFGLGLEMYMDAEDREQADPEAERETKPTKAQTARMKQLVELVPEDNEDLNKMIADAREGVGSAVDKKFRIGVAIEMLEDAMKEAGLEVPDPT